MGALIHAELLRVVSRRSVMMFFAIVAFLTLLQSVLLVSSARPVSESDRRVAQAAFQEYQKEIAARGMKAAEKASGDAGKGGDGGSASQETETPARTVEDFLRHPDSFSEVITSQYSSGFGLLLLLVVGVAVTVCTLDFRYGANATQLTFTPSRIGLLTARVAAATLTGVALASVAVVIGMLVSTLGFLAMRPASELILSPELGVHARGAFLVVLISSFLMALVAMMLGSEVLSVVLFCAVVIASTIIENVSNVSLWIRMLLPTTNMQAIGSGTFGIKDWGKDSSDFTVVYTIGFSQGLLVMVGYAVVLAAVTAWSFHRRDIA